MSAEDFDEGGAVVEARVDQKQIALFERPNKLEDEFVFRGADLVVDEAQRCPADQVKQAAQLYGDRAQSLLTLVGAEALPKRLRLR